MAFPQADFAHSYLPKNRIPRSLYGGHYRLRPFPDLLEYERLTEADAARDEWLKENAKLEETPLGVVDEVPNKDTVGKERDLSNQAGSGRPPGERAWTLRTYYMDTGEVEPRHLAPELEVKQDVLTRLPPAPEPKLHATYEPAAQKRSVKPRRRPGKKPRPSVQDLDEMTFNLSD